MALTKVTGSGVGTLVSDLTVTSTDAGASAGPTLDLYRNSASPADGDLLGRISFTGESEGTGIHSYGTIDMEVNGVGDGSEKGKMIFKVSLPDGDLQNIFHIDRTEVCVNEDSEDIDFRVESDTKSHAFFMRGSDGNILINASADRDPPSHVTIEFEGGSYSALAAQFTDNASGSGFFVCRKADGATIGQIARNGTADSVQYLTTSDYRLKENVSYDFNATSQLKQLKPCTFTWKNDESKTTHQGFLAHEVQTILPHAINGKKDAVDEEGKIEAQSIDKGDLVPLLVKTIQELEARITALESA